MSAGKVADSGIVSPRRDEVRDTPGTLRKEADLHALAFSGLCPGFAWLPSPIDLRMPRRDK